MTLETLNILVGLLTPIPVSFMKGLLTNDKTPKWVIYFMSLVISVLYGIATALVMGYDITDYADILKSISIVVAFAQTSYNTIITEVGLDSKIVDGVKNLIKS